MFESVGIRRPVDYAIGVQSLDVGAIAEALIFYGHTNLLLDPGSLTDSLRTIGPDSLLRLAKSDFASVHYSHQQLAFPPPGPYWNVSTMSVDSWKADRFVKKSLEDLTGRPGYSRRYAGRLLRELQLIDLNETSVLEDAKSDLLTPDLVAKWWPVVLSNVAPTYAIPPDAYFRVRSDDAAIVIETNLDFIEITAAYRELTGRTDNAIDGAHLLLAMAEVQQDLSLADELKSDLSVTPMRSELLRLYEEDLLTSGPELDGPGRLQDFLFDDARAISEAVNSGRLSFEKVLDLVESSRPLHSFLIGLPPDADVVKEYFKDATSGTMVDSLPKAVARWLLIAGGTTAIGTAVPGLPGAAIGAGLSGIDAALSYRKRTLTPNHFLGTQVRKALRD